VQDGQTAVLAITNRHSSGISIHKINFITKDGIYNVPFVLYDANNNTDHRWLVEGYIVP